MMGGSYRRSLTSTFIPEFLSMNFLMAGMVLTATVGRALIGIPLHPDRPEFWFAMSMALLVGFVISYPANWWLVTRGLKHGMMTVRPNEPHTGHGSEEPSHQPGGEPAYSAYHMTETSHNNLSTPTVGELLAAIGLSVLVFAVALAIYLAINVS